MGKARSFRLTKQNEVRLEEIMKRMDADNPNRCFNEIIEHYHYYEKYKRAIRLLGELINELMRQRKEEAK